LLATSFPAAAKKVQASKDKSSAAEKKHKSVADRKKQKVSGSKKASVTVRKEKPSVSAKEEPITIPEPRTPVDKQDCIAAAQAFYGKAQSLARRTNQTVTKEFQQVVTKLDEFCGEEEFEKARTGLNWINLCLQNFTYDNRVEFCSRNAGFFCVVDEDTCIAGDARAE
jgi:hypothetical protein